MSDNYLYLHCDEWKSNASMDPSCDDILYRNRAGRRTMWRKIKEDYENNVILIPSHRLEKVRFQVLRGNPCDANDYLTYAYIMHLEEAK